MRFGPDGALKGMERETNKRIARNNYDYYVCSIWINDRKMKKRINSIWRNDDGLPCILFEFFEPVRF